MSRLTLYRQTRVDEGVRDGISVDDTTVLHNFEPGNQDHDPALLWYIDVRCDGDALPTEADEVRQWFVQHGDMLKQALRDAAEVLSVGIDNELQPFEWQVTKPPEGSEIRILASAVRRIEARDIAQHIEAFRNDWDALLQRLAPLANV